MSTDRPNRKKPRRNRVDEESDSPFAESASPQTRAAVRAYRYAVFGLIPGAGLVLGPAAVFLGMWARRKGKSDPHYRGRSLARAAILLGVGLWVTTWAGAYLMIQALK